MGQRVKGYIILSEYRNISVVEKNYHIGFPNIKFVLLTFKRDKGSQNFLYSFLHIDQKHLNLRERVLRDRTLGKDSVLIICRQKLLIIYRSNFKLQLQ